MIQALFKFVAVWFAALLLTGAVVYFSSGSVDALDPAIETGLTENCSRVTDGFEEDSRGQCLAQVANQLEGELAEARSNLIYWHMIAGVVVLVAGLMFMVQIVQRGTIAGVASDFRSMRGTWMAYLLAIVAVALLAGVLAHVTDMFGHWATILNPARGWGIPAFMALVWPAVYWGGTVIGTPDKMKPSIPGA